MSITLRSSLTILFATMLLWPLAINRTAILYPDTGRYLMNGLNIWHAIEGRHTRALPQSSVVLGRLPNTNPNINFSSEKPKVTLGGRSPYYGAFAWEATEISGLGGIAIAQAVWVALVLITALPYFMGVSSAQSQIITVATLAFLSPLAFFTNVVMPDVFAGVMVIAVFILWEKWPAGWTTRFWWLSNVLAAALFHTSFLLLAVTLICCLAFIDWREWRMKFTRAITLVSALAAGLVGTVGMDLGIKHATGRAVTPIPYLLARTIGDGTAARILREDCQTKHYATCRDVNQLPMTENDFLWGRPGLVGWNALDSRLQNKIVDEQRVIVTSAITRYPLQQAARSMRNALLMFFTLDVDEFGYSQKLEHPLQNPLFQAERVEAESSRIYRERLTLRPFSILWSLMYIASTFCIVTSLIFRRQLRLRKGAVAAAGAFLLALLLSAAIQGVLGGVWGRYTARIAWLAILGVVVIAKDIWRFRSSAAHDFGDV